MLFLYLYEMLLQNERLQCPHKMAYLVWVLLLDIGCVFFEDKEELIDKGLPVFTEKKIQSKGNCKTADK